MEKRELVIVGAGPAGISAAIAAQRRGLRDILIIDRLPQVGGILPQCLHRGFERAPLGALTGPEYVKTLLTELGDGVEVRTGAFVTEMTGGGVVTVAGSRGVCGISAGAVILAAGCRERTVGSLPVYGSRPAGVFTAGSVQKMLNLSGYHVGIRAVVLGSGDVGMIVAHHLAASGAEVPAVIEKARGVGGLMRNKRLYLDTHSIPLITEHTITELHGARRLEAVTVCRVDKTGKPIPDSGYRLECDTLISSVGLVPELELIRDLPLRFEAGVLSGDSVATEIPWLFVCGNARRVHSLVGSVATEGARAGECAAHYLSCGSSTTS